VLPKRPQSWRKPFQKTNHRQPAEAKQTTPKKQSSLHLDHALIAGRSWRSPRAFQPPPSSPPNRPTASAFECPSICRALKDPVSSSFRPVETHSVILPSLPRHHASPSRRGYLRTHLRRRLVPWLPGSQLKGRQCWRWPARGINPCPAGPHQSLLGLHHLRLRAVPQPA